MKTYLLKVLWRVFAAFIVGLVVPSSYGLQNATLTWDPNLEPVAGYIIYYGDASGHYTNSIDVGNVITTTVSNLVEGATYYFVATAYDTYGQESDPSIEIMYKVNNPPIAVPDSVCAPPNITTRFTPGTFLRNDVDLDGDTRTIIPMNTNSVANGVVMVLNGVVYYTPPQDFMGIDYFDYTITDGKGGTSTAQVTVTVQAPPKPVRSSSSIVPLGDGTIEARFNGLPGFTFAVEASTDLQTWVRIGTATADENGQVVMVDADAAKYSMRYYHITTL